MNEDVRLAYRGPPWLPDPRAIPYVEPRVSAPDYLDQPERYPTVTYRPQLPQSGAMVRAPLSPQQIMGDPVLALHNPAQDLNSRITAPGMALSALVAPPPDMRHGVAL